MTTAEHKRELQKNRAELADLEATLEYVQTEIAKKKRKIAALTDLVNIDEESPAPSGLVSGITDAVRTVLRGAEKRLNPAEVKARVEALGLPPQQNLLASVHTVLRRLVISGEAELGRDANGDDGYLWIRDYTGGDLHIMGKRLREAMARMKKR